MQVGNFERYITLSMFLNGKFDFFTDDFHALTGQLILKGL